MTPLNEASSYLMFVKQATRIKEWTFKLVDQWILLNFGIVFCKRTGFIICFRV